VVQGHAQRHVDLLVEKGSATLLSDGQVQQLLNQIAQVIDQLPQVVKNAHERITGGRPVANEGKIHSLYDEHVNVIVRRKAGSAVEFGNTLLLAEQRDGLIVDWELFRDSAPADTRLLQPSQERIKERLGIEIALTGRTEVLTVRPTEIIWKTKRPLTPSVPEIPICYQSDLKKNGFVRLRIDAARPKG
jgi:hypothetical protein